MITLRYNIYSNINDDGFLHIRKLLIPIEQQMFQILKSLDWHLHSTVAHSDALIIDFLKNESIYSGNLGIEFEDKYGQITFSFYVTKGFDKNGYRYFLKDYIFKSKNIEFFSLRIEEFTGLAVSKYDEWSENQIISLGEKIKLSQYPG